MATGPRYRVPFRRRREGKTDYRQRLHLLISKQPRIVARSSLRHMRLQLATPKPEGDNTWVHADSSELEKYGYTGSTGNTPAAYLTGLLSGIRPRQRVMRTPSWIWDYRSHPKAAGYMLH